MHTHTLLTAAAATALALTAAVVTAAYLFRDTPTGSTTAPPPPPGLLAVLRFLAVAVLPLVAGGLFLTVLAVLGDTLPPADALNALTALARAISTTATDAASTLAGGSHNPTSPGNP